MPISVTCPCSARLKVADTAAGKTVKCPKCGKAVAVPDTLSDFELVPDEEAPPPKRKPRVVDEDDDDDRPRPKKKSAPLEVDEPVDDDEEEDEDEKPRRKKSRVADDDDDDDDDDRPRKKGKGKGGKRGKKPQPKSNLPLLLGVGGGALALLVVVGVIVTVVLMNGGKDTAKGTPTSPAAPVVPPPPPGPQLPAGWSSFKGEGFSVAVPDSAKFALQSTPGQQGKTWGSAGVVGPPPPGQFVYLVSIGEMPADVKPILDENPNMIGTFMKVGLAKGGSSPFGPGVKVDSDKKVPFEGGEAFQLALKGPQVGGYLRFFYRKGKMFTWGVMSTTLPDENDVGVKTFLESFKPE